jgi:hypothetical protein
MALILMMAGGVVGAVGSGRVLQAVRSMDLDVPSTTQPGSWVADVFAPELLRTARNGVGDLSGAEPGRPLGGRTMLVLAWGSQLWLLSSDLVAREIEHFVAIGSGRSWAYGAWSALEGLDLDPLTGSIASSEPRAPTASRSTVPSATSGPPTFPPSALFLPSALADEVVDGEFRDAPVGGNSWSNADVSAKWSYPNRRTGLAAGTYRLTVSVAWPTGSTSRMKAQLTLAGDHVTLGL